MRRVAGCLVVALLASAAAWMGCRDDGAELESQFAVGSGTDAGGSDGLILNADADVIGSDGGGEPGPGSDAGSGSGSDGGTTGSGSDGGTSGSGSDGGTTGSGSDAGVPDDGDTEGSTDDAGNGTGPGGRRGAGDDPVDRTSFYACAGGGSGSAIGTGLGLPFAAVIALALRRRRRRRTARSGLRGQ